jgi:hypothetical protein
VRAVTETLTIDPALTAPGTYHLVARTAYNGRVRYQPADRLLTLTAPIVIPALTSVERIGGVTTIGITGQAGQTLVLEVSPQLIQWTPLATNTLTDASWVYQDASAPLAPHQFYRARVAP